ncbi:MAG: Cna B-type protein, partial [Bryobacterales bacterium]|nr:Cna B-type protein [Bryobacterales bacterium]
PGFNTHRMTVNVSPGTATTADVKLEVGQESTAIQVTEDFAQVDTENQTVATTISQTQVSNLPSLTRNPYDFMALSGNVSNSTGGTTLRGANGYAINGQRSTSTNVLLDGSANNDEFYANVGQQVPLDSVEEFTILTSTFTAEFGRAGGGVVNVVTKSGTNSFHGSVYEYNRVSALASNSFNNNANGIPNPVFTRNQFGFSVGGPVIKNKLFFFQNTEWIRVRAGSVNTAYVPTPQLIAAAAPTTRSFFSSLGALGSGTSILQSYTRNQLIGLGQDPCKGGAATGACAAFDPNTPMFSRVAYATATDQGAGIPQNTYELVGRVDYNLSDKTQMYGRYALYSEADALGSVSYSPYSGYNSGQTFFNNNGLFSVTHTFTPRLVTQDKVVFNRLNNIQPFGAAPISPTLYTGPSSSATILGNNIAFPGYDPFTPGNSIPFGGPQNFVQLYHDMSYVVGQHQFRFGGSYVYLRDNRTFGAYETAVEALSSGNLGQSLDNFLTGNLYELQVAINPQGKYPCSSNAIAATNPPPSCAITLPATQPNFSRSNRYHEFSAYVQDTRKVSKNFTYNIGLRWEYYGVQHNKNQQLDSNFYDGSGATVQQQIRNGSVQIAPNSPVGGLWQPDYGDFAPRLGVAWDVFGNGKTSLRAGYGLGYERNFGNVTFNVIQNPPNYEVLAVFGSTASPVPLTTSNLGPLSGTSGTAGLRTASLRNVDAHISTAKAQNWSLTLEHELTPGVLVSLGYSGSAGSSLYGIAALNRLGYGNVYLGDPCSAAAGDCTSRLVNSQYTGINRRDSIGSSVYHSLNIGTTIRNVHHTGLDLVANYTWSHAIDNLSSTFSDTGATTANNGDFVLGYLDPFNPGLDRGSAEFDVRQRVTVAPVYQVPFFSNPGLTNKVLGGWTVSAIFVAQTGSPYSIFDSTNSLNYAPRAAFNGKVSGTSLINTGAPNTFQFLTFQNAQIDHFNSPLWGYSDLPPFPSNMSGRDAFVGPGRFNLDFSLYKSFKVSERFNVQLRGEAYNILNHSNLALIGGSADLGTQNYVTAQFGVLPTGNAERRNIQIAARVTF